MSTPFSHKPIFWTCTSFSIPWPYKKRSNCAGLRSTYFGNKHSCVDMSIILKRMSLQSKATVLGLRAIQLALTILFGHVHPSQATDVTTKTNALDVWTNNLNIKPLFGACPPSSIQWPHNGKTVFDSGAHHLARNLCAGHASHSQPHCIAKKTNNIGLMSTQVNPKPLFWHVHNPQSNGTTRQATNNCIWLRNTRIGPKQCVFDMSTLLNPMALHKENICVGLLGTPIALEHIFWACPPFSSPWPCKEKKQQYVTYEHI